MANDVKTLTLRFSLAKHERLAKLKEESGAGSWENFVERLAGISNE